MKNKPLLNNETLISLGIVAVLLSGGCAIDKNEPKTYALKESPKVEKNIPATTTQSFDDFFKNKPPAAIKETVVVKEPVVVYRYVPVHSYGYDWYRDKRRWERERRDYYRELRHDRRRWERERRYYYHNRMRDRVRDRYLRDRYYRYR